MLNGNTRLIEAENLIEATLVFSQKPTSGIIKKKMEPILGKALRQEQKI